jgi:putative transposase/transposase-like zinc-binding protein
MACHDPPSAALPGALTVGEVLRMGLPAYARAHRLPAHHWKALNAMQVCRTALLGAHQYQCAHCGRAHVVGHGCGNRHCPSCQGINSRHWLQAQASVLLPVTYFHEVFTLPHQLNPLIQQNQSAVYKLLFDSVAQTLLSFGRNNLGAQLGVTAVLHTWSQTLVDHYHLHCIVSGGGPTLDGSRWVRSRSDYLFPVRALSKVFRAKFCEGLQGLYAKGQLQFQGQLRPLALAASFQELMRQATRKPWVVYSKRPFAGPEQVLAYLSRYTHRVGISNRRLLGLDRRTGTVTFDYKDYADGARHKSMSLRLEEFIRRLRLHLLPPRFVKIRHYGLLANRGRRERLQQARALLGVYEPGEPALPERGLLKCPHCGWAALILVGVVPPLRRQAPALLDTS